LSNIKILGVGNLVRQDEGLGIHLLQALQNKLPPVLPAGIELLDGGTGGLILLDYVESAEKLLILDAVAAGREPGEIVIWQKEEIPYFIAPKMTVHQVSLAEVLHWAKFRGKYPQDIVVVGIQPKCLDWGTKLSEEVRNSLPAALHEVLSILKKWGVKL
jgi:hydrogenase maturation protease